MIFSCFGNIYVKNSYSDNINVKLYNNLIWLLFDVVTFVIYTNGINCFDSFTRGTKLRPLNSNFWDFVSYCCTEYRLFGN